MTDTTTAGAKSEATAGTQGPAPTEAKTETATETKDATESGAKTEGSTSDAPPGYTRGENQKPVTQAYRNNWDKIFGKKTDG